MAVPERETLLHTLYEAAELEHNLMCTYLYAAFSLKDGTGEGLEGVQAETVQRWRREIMAVAIEEMGHLVAMWNLTSALGGAPRFGRANFPLDPGYLPASIVVKLAPFDAGTLQHFIFLERPAGSTEPEGPGFAPETRFQRGSTALRLTPVAMDYDTVGAFYAALAADLGAFVAAHGEEGAFCGDPGLQLGTNLVALPAAAAVRCNRTALAAIDAIVRQGEGAAGDSEGSHYQRFTGIRAEMQDLLRADPGFRPAHPAATNPVLRRPPRPEGRVWLEDAGAIATVDLANATYQLMLRLLALAYALPAASPDKAVYVDLAMATMRAMTPLGEQAARLPAGPSNPHCQAGMSFTALRDASALPADGAGRRFVTERLHALAQAASGLAAALPTARTARAAALLQAAAERAQRQLSGSRAALSAAASSSSSAASISTSTSTSPSPATPATPAPTTAPASVVSEGVETVQGDALELSFDTRRCIHARFCVTGAPQVFLANVKGPWIFPDAMPVARVVEIAHACPSGAIQYRRKDGEPDETAPPVNLVSVREAGPYALRGDLVLQGRPIGTRATLCRCGASRNKPYCDGSHHDANFAASGEPATGVAGQPTEMLPVRDGPVEIEPEVDGPLAVRGSVEVLSGTGRMVCRVQQARLCRCGGSATKPFCDGTHARIGFRST